MNGRRMNFTLPVSTYLATKAGRTSLENAAQCGQVGDAYSITVTLASGLPSTLSGTPAGAISAVVATLLVPLVWAPCTGVASRSAGRVKYQAPPAIAATATT